MGRPGCWAGRTLQSAGLWEEHRGGPHLFAHRGRRSQVETLRTGPSGGLSEGDEPRNGTIRPISRAVCATLAHHSPPAEW
jgi:hypothetical protein